SLAAAGSSVAATSRSQPVARCSPASEPPGRGFRRRTVQMVVHADSDYARALKLETDTIGGSVTGVLSEVAGPPQRVTADIIVGSGGAGTSAALRLRSPDR